MGGRMSGKPAARLGDIASGHGCHHPPSPAIEGSPNVFINGLPAVREGDAYMEHGCPTCSGGAPHPRKLAAGSPTVFINGRPAGRVGDAIDCGGSVLTGSPNVFIGALSSPGTRKPFQEECDYAHDAD